MDPDARGENAFKIITLAQGPRRVTRGRCYDHNFRQFLEFFGKKMAFFSKTNVMIKFLNNLALFGVKNANFFTEFFCKNILKIITSVPDAFLKKLPKM
jgi:hypothetical protein